MLDSVIDFRWGMGKYQFSWINNMLYDDVDDQRDGGMSSQKKSVWSVRVGRYR